MREYETMPTWALSHYPLKDNGGGARRQTGVHGDYRGGGVGEEVDDEEREEGGRRREEKGVNDRKLARGKTENKKARKQRAKECKYKKGGKHL